LILCLASGSGGGEIKVELTTIQGWLILLKMTTSGEDDVLVTNSRVIRTESETSRKTIAAAAPLCPCTWHCLIAILLPLYLS
jgi:hypothetical protein